ncbi:hypothetical protein RF11_00676 [Thelohanellus kitauei]|uniref:Tetraspanin n=1 Tax=Thelohanellus kitauei TaxID=669202 RepID=A0A0C2MVC9_THEKT|nr:hypothetical protein RF11_00676 [Thelohanellus kitauei]
MGATISSSAPIETIRLMKVAMKIVAYVILGFLATITLVTLVASSLALFYQLDFCGNTGLLSISELMTLLCSVCLMMVIIGLLAVAVKSHALGYTYTVMCGIIIIGSIIVVAKAVLMSTRFITNLDKCLNNVPHIPVRRLNLFLLYAQQKHRCCGINGPTEWGTDVSGVCCSNPPTCNQQYQGNCRQIYFNVLIVIACVFGVAIFFWLILPPIVSWILFTKTGMKISFQT